MDTVSIAFSGSGFKFASHIGALFAIQDSGRDIVEVSGVSGGSLVASMVACGMSQEEMYNVAFDLDLRPFMKLSWASLKRGALFDGDAILETTRELSKGLRFSQTSIPLYVTATNITYNSMFVFSKDRTPNAFVAEALRSSVSIPVIYPPYEYQGNLLVDGVINTSLPLNLLRNPDSQKIGIRMVNGNSAASFSENPFTAARRAIIHMVDHKDDWALDSGEFGEVIKVDTRFVSGLDPKISRSMRERLFDVGYHETKKRLSELG